MFSRTYILIVIAFAVAGAVVIQLATWISDSLGADSAWHLALVLVPVAALLGVALRMEWRQFRAWDELQRRVHLEAMTLASAAMVSYVCFVTIIEFFTGEPLAPMYSVVGVHGGTYFGALLILRRRYQ